MQIFWMYNSQIETQKWENFTDDNLVCGSSNLIKSKVLAAGQTCWVFNHDCLV